MARLGTTSDPVGFTMVLRIPAGRSAALSMGLQFVAYSLYIPSVCSVIYLLDQVIIYPILDSPQDFIKKERVSRFI